MAHASLMGLYRHLGRLDEGEAQYRAVLRVNPDIPEVHYNYGFLLIDRGKPEEAINAFERALELNPSYADAHANLAVLMTGSDQSSRAITHLRKALEIDRNHRLARYNLARLLLQKGETSESIQLLSGALREEDQETAEIEALLTTACAMAGLWPQAERYGRRALRLSEKYGQSDLARTVRYDLGRSTQSRSRIHGFSSSWVTIAKPSIYSVPQPNPRTSKSRRSFCLWPALTRRSVMRNWLLSMPQEL